MPMTFDGNGTITGLSAGGLPDSSIVTADIANAAITAAKLDGAQNGSAPIYAARAWVNFNGTGTVAIRASGNVSSITDNGVGSYTANLTNGMSDSNFACTCAVRQTGVVSISAIYPLTANSISIATFNAAGGNVDFEQIQIAAYR